MLLWLAKCVSEDAGRISWNYELTITNVCFDSKRVGEYEYAPSFSTKHADFALRWSFRFYYKSHADNRFACIVLEHDLRENDLMPNTKLALLSKNREKVIEFTEAPFHPWFVERSYIMDKDNGIFSNNEMRIACEISIDLNAHENTILEYPHSLKMHEDYEKLFETGLCSDVVFIADGKELRLHKSVLMARSSVFEATFSHSMKESANNAVEVEDVRYEVLRELFRYIYAGQANGIENFADDLLVVAERYLVQGLKTMCEEVLCKNLTFDNVLGYLSLADTNNAPDLESQAISFVVSNLEHFIGDPTFESFCESHSNLPFKILCATARMNKMEI